MGSREGWRSFSFMGNAKVVEVAETLLYGKNLRGFVLIKLF